MRVFGYGLGFTVALGLGLALGGGCAASTQTRLGSGTGGGSGASGTGATGTGATGTGANGTGGGTMLTSSGSGSSSGSPVDAGCANFHAAATQAPAAMLILLQASSSMNLGTKWPAAQQAIAQAIDDDAFDTISLGMMTFPLATQVTGPACILNLPVNCGTSGLPQIPVQPAGTNKTTSPTGVRHDIYQYLVNNGPVPEATDPANSTPLYDAMNNAYNSLKGTNIAKRILVVVTDGGGSCTSLSVPQRPAYNDPNDCPDWEEPANFNQLISKWNTDPTTPIDTFIVGVPGSNSTANQMIGFYDTAPYDMLLALSTYAVSGSPSTVPANCDKTAVFSQTGAAPAVPCHIDLSGNNFSPSTLADAIASIRGKELGCVYNLPTPPAGQTINPDQVNVVETINGMQYTIPKRSNPNDMCLGSSPCWDYNSQGQVVLIGAGCSAVQASATATVDIYVGCATITK
jgi:hypothetical protein